MRLPKGVEDDDEKTTDCWLCPAPLATESGIGSPSISIFGSLGDIWRESRSGGGMEAWRSRDVGALAEGGEFGSSEKKSSGEEEKGNGVEEEYQEEWTNPPPFLAPSNHPSRFDCEASLLTRGILFTNEYVETLESCDLTLEGEDESHSPTAIRV
ncbi:hypothetical protein ACLOJK_030086 [Asimina triloba]